MPTHLSLQIRKIYVHKAYFPKTVFGTGQFANCCTVVVLATSLTDIFDRERSPAIQVIACFVGWIRTNTGTC